MRECKDVGRVRCAEGRACQRVQGPPPLSLRGAKRRGNPYSLQYHKTKRNTLGKYEKHCEFALSTTDLPGISAGKRIATPVCALVRNDMQKEETCQRLQGRLRNDMQKAVACQRLQGRFPAVHRQCVLAPAHTCPPSACHCEERSDVAIRNSCGSTNRKAILWANTKSATNSP